MATEYTRFMAKNKLFSILMPAEWYVNTFVDVGRTTTTISSDKFDSEKIQKHDVVIVRAGVKIEVSDIRLERQQWSIKELVDAELSTIYKYLELHHKDLKVEHVSRDDDYRLNGKKGILVHDYHVTDKDNEFIFFYREKNKFIAISYGFLDSEKNTFNHVLKKMVKSFRLHESSALKLATYKTRRNSISMQLPTSWYSVDANNSKAYFFIASKNKFTNFNDLKEPSVQVVEINNPKKHFRIKNGTERLAEARMIGTYSNSKSPYLIYMREIDNKRALAKLEWSIKYSPNNIVHAIHYYILAKNNKYYEITFRAKEENFELYRASFDSAIASLKFN